MINARSAPILSATTAPSSEKMPMHSAMIEMIRPALLSEMPRPFLISWRIGAGASQANDCAVSSSSSSASIIHR